MPASTYVKKYFGAKLRALLLSLVLLLVIAWTAASFAQGRVEQLTSSFTKVTGTAVEETTTRQLKGTRRTKRYEEVPALEVEYQYQGGPNSTTIVRNDREVGDTLDLWVNDDTGDVQTAAPAVDTGQWFLLAGMALVIALWGWLVVRGFVRAFRIRGFDPMSGTERFLLHVQRLVPQKSGKNSSLRALCVVQSSSADAGTLATGQQVTVQFDPRPPTDRFPAQLEGSVAISGKLGDTVLVRGAGATDWWVASTHTPTAQDRNAAAGQTT